ncbi:hypothetical protein Y032_0008g188 [Ancylostoma ceylanicum]|uniref:Uncharacterized protein n=1 Tax=Ancylostoma ceylanicum TaxID=53326 RepID=A0A016VJK1_9BILA|nr:hypothetical protein Y032_0008g188 [Ancylostoma ceylanicum]
MLRDFFVLVNESIGGKKVRENGGVHFHTGFLLFFSEQRPEHPMTNSEKICLFWTAIDLKRIDLAETDGIKTVAHYLDF